MRRLLRLVVIVGLSCALLVGGVLGVGRVSHGFIHDTATATEIPLPALTDNPLVGSTVYADDGTVLAVEQASMLREPVPLSRMPKVLINAVLDTEDTGFYVHGGLDVRSALRAAASDSSSSGGLQGGSDITQQLVKQNYVGSARTISRKIKEAVLAERLQQKYTKNQILQAYLNTIYLGSSAYGVQAAANIFFNEDVSQLTLPQAALLAGNIQDPSGYDPITHPTLARQRRHQVLTRMVKEHTATQAQADAANLTPLPTSTTPLPTSANTPANSYVEQVVNQLLHSADSPLGTNVKARRAALYEGGFKIYTNYDPTLQAQAIAAVTKDTPANSGGFEEALVSLDPSTGKVRALVGGTTHFDIVTQGTRQPGSGFKIFTLLAALEQGYSINSAVDATAPCAVAFPPSATGTSSGDNDLLKPKSAVENDEGPGSGGETTIGNATAQSFNCAFIRIAHEVKLTSVISMAQQLGITATLNAYPSMVLGDTGLPPIEMAAAYAAVADGGVYHAPSFIDHVVDKTGATTYNGQNPGKVVVSPFVAAEATTAFRAVVISGTGRGAAVVGHDVAGKTGTAGGPKDAWFNGFTPQLETTVWMGNLDTEKVMFVNGTQVYGGTFPAKTFHDFMTAALAKLPNVPLSVLSPGAIPAGRPVASPALSKDDQSKRTAAKGSSSSYGYGANGTPVTVPAAAGVPTTG